jgi:hypothetical protein
MKKIMNMTMAIAFLLSIAIPVQADKRKFVTKDYDVSNENEVLTINIKDDGLVGGRPKYYNIAYTNLENGVVMTFMKKIATSKKRRQALGFTNNRIDRRENISVASESGISIHTFRVKRKLLKRDKLALFRLRQFEIDPLDPDAITFVKETNVRVNIIPEEASSCVAVPTCARLDYVDKTIYKEYPTTCIGGGVAVAAANCSS